MRKGFWSKDGGKTRGKFTNYIFFSSFASLQFSHNTMVILLRTIAIWRFVTEIFKETDNLKNQCIDIIIVIGKKIHAACLADTVTCNNIPRSEPLRVDHDRC